MACALLLIPTVLTEPAVATLSSGKGKKRSFWKPTAAESMSSFIDLQKPGLDLKSHIKEKEDALRSKGLRLQPHVVVIAEDVSDIGSANGCVVYAILSKTVIYELSSLMAAVDVCIKMCFVFNLQYNHSSRSSWLFIQKSVYNIATSYDIKNSKVLQLLADCSRS